jgi:predicted CoA-binding protein
LNHDHYPDDLIRDVLTSTKSIAVVGASPNPARASHRVTDYLVQRGYTVFAVNPGHAGKMIAGALTYASLADLPQPVDMVDVFRAPEHLNNVVADALALSTHPKVIWGQLTVRDDQAAKIAEDAGITVIQNRCPKIEIPRLGL